MSAMMTHETIASETDKRLHNLIDDSWRDYLWNVQKPFVVTPSMPVLFFGDLPKYFASPIRIVTVGLNPSRIEFPIADRFLRFPKARSLDPLAKDAAFHQQYVEALSDYFCTDPYMRWFNAYEFILNGLSGSYRHGASNTAIHTDICSPLATDPTWSGLSPADRTALESRGAALWHRLIEYLAPDVLLVSIAKHMSDMIAFQTTTDWETIHTIERDNPYHVQARTIRVIEGKDTYVIFGLASQTPFGKVSNEDKRILGACVKEYING